MHIVLKCAATAHAFTFVILLRQSYFSPATFSYCNTSLCQRGSLGEMRRDARASGLSLSTQNPRVCQIGWKKTEVFSTTGALKMASSNAKMVMAIMATLPF